MTRRIDLTGARFGKLVALRPSGMDSTGKTVWECACDCGANTKATSLNLKKGNTKSCGCLKRRQGEENPRFKPVDRVKKQMQKRALSEFKRWRRRVLTRTPVCIRCGAEDRLEAHHILGNYEFPEHRVDVKNGVALCKPCHVSFHVQYGRRTGFGKSDLREFIESDVAEIVWLVLMRDKNGIADLKKARHLLDILIELEERV